MNTVLQIQVRNWKNHTHNLGVDTEPDACPICHRAIEPVDPRWDFFIESSHPPQWIERVFRCPKKDCQRLFIARYAQDPISPALFRLHRCVPAALVDFKFSSEIQTISPDFCSIYNEAGKAEQNGYMLVCGPGYRKAVEFLVKDYVIRLHSDQAEKIKKMNLGSCIADFVTSEKVKQVASRATWLGNDETHYLRKWDTKDLQDLKALIALTVHWIEMEELTAATIKDMPEGKK